MPGQRRPSPPAPLPSCRVRQAGEGSRERRAESREQDKARRQPKQTGFGPDLPDLCRILSPLPISVRLTPDKAKKTRFPPVFRDCPGAIPQPPAKALPPLVIENYPKSTIKIDSESVRAKIPHRRETPNSKSEIRNKSQIQKSKSKMTAERRQESIGGNNRSLLMTLDCYD